jgi:hypothetical protein
MFARPWAARVARGGAPAIAVRDVLLRAEERPDGILALPNGFLKTLVIRSATAIDRRGSKREQRAVRASVSLMGVDAGAMRVWIADCPKTPLRPMA